MTNLLIVGSSQRDVASRVAPGGRWEVHANCDSLDQFAAILGIQPDNSVDRLDIVDHGGHGYIFLGEDVLFRSDDDIATPLVNAHLADAIRNKLTSMAQVRLLGCRTSEGWSDERAGRLLLLKLARILNQGTSFYSRIVFGTIDRVDAGDFDGDGLRRSQELALLYSSLAAIDYDSPSYYQRLKDIDEFDVGRIARAQRMRALGTRLNRGIRELSLQRFMSLFR